LQKVPFPAAVRMTDGARDTTSPHPCTHRRTSAPAASGAQTVTAYNNANTTSTASFTVTNDTSAPTPNTPTVTAGYYTTTSVDVTGLGGSDGTGAGADTTTGVLERANALLTNGSCG